MRNHLIGVAIFLILAGISAPAAAKWGCAASGVGYWSRSSAQPSQAQARANALLACQGAGGRECYVFACSPNVDTPAQALALWPAPSKASAKPVPKPTASQHIPEYYVVGCFTQPVGSPCSCDGKNCQGKCDSAGACVAPH
jgi:hypothetical protein